MKTEKSYNAVLMPVQIIIGTTILKSIVVSDLTKKQLYRALDFGATYIFQTGYCHTIPIKLSRALTDAGWVCVKLGWTNYKTTTWGASKIG